MRNGRNHRDAISITKKPIHPHNNNGIVNTFQILTVARILPNMVLISFKMTIEAIVFQLMKVIPIVKISLQLKFLRMLHGRTKTIISCRQMLETPSTLPRWNKSIVPSFTNYKSWMTRFMCFVTYFMARSLNFREFIWRKRGMPWKKSWGCKRWSLR